MELVERRMQGLMGGIREEGGWTSQKEMDLGEAPPEMGEPPSYEQAMGKGES